MPAAAQQNRRYVRKPPPFPVRLAIGVLLYGVFAPLNWASARSKTFERWMDKLGERRANNGFDKAGFAGFEPGPQDVFVCTFAKSGTNWMMQIALQLAYHGDVKFEHIHELVPWPDMSRIPYAIPLAQADHWQTAPERKRIIKTHLYWPDLPYSSHAHYIAVIRDPKDVFVSSYHFAKAIMGAAMPSVEAWLRMFLNERFPFGGSWVKNTAGYWEASQRPNVLVCSFKEMKRDLRGAVESVAAFLGIEAAPEVIERVVAKSSFDHMKRHDSQFAMFQLRPWGDPVVMIREGKQGGSGSLLTRDQRREIDTRFQAALKQLGSDFPYERFCDIEP